MQAQSAQQAEAAPAPAATVIRASEERQPDQVLREVPRAVPTEVSSSQWSSTMDSNLSRDRRPLRIAPVARTPCHPDHSTARLHLNLCVMDGHQRLTTHSSRAAG